MDRRHLMGGDVRVVYAVRGPKVYTGLALDFIE